MPKLWCAKQLAPLAAVVLASACRDTSIVSTMDATGANTSLVAAAPSTAAVASIAVAVALNPIASGQTTTATATLYDAQGNVTTNRPVQWSSSNGTVLRVANDGSVSTSLLPGTADVIATSEGVTGRLRVTVTLTQVRVASVSVAVDSSTLAPGHTAQATATTRDAYGNVMTRPITWSSSNMGVATVSSDGIVTAVSGGAADIIATSDGKSGWATMRVVVPTATVASVTVTTSASSILVGQTTQAYATARDASSNIVSGRPTTWTSSNTAVATVSNAGLITAVAAGSATVSATIDSQVGQATITVSQVPVASVTVTLNAPSLAVGQVTQANATARDANNNALTGRAIAWSSSNTAVATVDSTGRVTAVAVGSANIVATSEGKSGQATATVNQVPVASVTVSPSSASMNVGQTAQLTATTRDANNTVLTGRSVAWSSSNASIATVSASGLVTGVSAGSATILASSEGKTGSATIAVASNTSTGNASISGTVSDPSSGAVGGGVVEILSGSTIIQTVPVQSNGTFAVSSLSTGNYGVRLQPTFAYSMGPSEPAQQSISVTSGQTTTMSFAVQRALYADDFQSYTSSNQLNSGTMAPGNFWYGPNHDIGAVSNPSAISLDPSGGLNGGKAMRYNWPARPSAACTADEMTVGIMPRLNPPPSGLKDLWVRFTSKESPNFEHGRTGCGGRSYKFFLLQFESGYYGRSGRFGTYLGDASSSSMLPTRLWMDMNDNQGSQNMNGALPIGGDVSWGGQYHTWVIEIRGIGSSNATFRTYMDGQLVGTITGAFLNGQTLGPGWALTLEMGANINNGPDHAQSRWFRELGVYTTRPSLIP
jgi:uncharacterized protein YjdB